MSDNAQVFGMRPGQTGQAGCGPGFWAASGTSPRLTYRVEKPPERSISVNQELARLHEVSYFLGALAHGAEQNLGRGSLSFGLLAGKKFGVEAVQGVQPTEDPIEAIKGIKAQLQRIPNRGYGYWLLRYLAEDDDLRAKLSERGYPQVSLNFAIRPEDHSTPLFVPAEEKSPPGRKPDSRTYHVLAVSCFVVVGAETSVQCVYSANVHRRATIERFVDDLCAFVRRIALTTTSAL